MLELFGATGAAVIGLVGATGATVLGFSGAPAATLGGGLAAVQAESSSSNDTAAAQIARRRKVGTELLLVSSNHAVAQAVPTATLLPVSPRAPASPQGVSKVATSGRDRFAGALGQDRLSGSANEGERPPARSCNSGRSPIAGAPPRSSTCQANAISELSRRTCIPPVSALTGSPAKRLGGDHADTREGGLETPLMGANDAPASPAPLSARVVAQATH